MATPGKSTHEPKPKAPSGTIVRSTLRDKLDVMDHVEMEVLGDRMDTKKANTLISASRQWNGLVNTAIRASRSGLPERVKEIAGLPEKTKMELEKS